MPTTEYKFLTTPESTAKPVTHEDLAKLATQVDAKCVGIISVQRIDTAGANTWRKSSTPGAKFYDVEVLGAGAGGGGVTGAGSGVGSGGGGGSGGYVRKLFAAADLPDEVTVTIGAGGPGGGGGATGTSGGNTTFTGLTGGGGSGGGGDTATTGSSAAGDGIGGTATGGDLNIPGAYGDPGRVLSGANVFLGRGAASAYGPQTRSTGSTGGNGISAAGYGAGGSGAYANTVTRTGGNGASGLCIVTAYI